MMDFCDAVGIEPVFTTNAVGPETPEDMADLVEVSEATRQAPPQLDFQGYL